MTIQKFLTKQLPAESVGAIALSNDGRRCVSRFNSRRLDTYLSPNTNRHSANTDRHKRFTETEHDVAKLWKEVARVIG
jgi:hypothetical protein